MVSSIAEHRGFIVGVIFIVLSLGLIASYVFGQRLIRTEKTDAVFGNPERALGGWHWVIAGVSSILLVWFYFSWDAARSYFPDAANELCQVAKVDTAINPMRSVFPIDSRLLKGTSLLARDSLQIEQLDRALSKAAFGDAEKAEYGATVAKLRSVLLLLAAPEHLSDETREKLDDIALRMDAATARLADASFPGEPDPAALAEALAQPGWGVSSTEIPDKPYTPRGRKFEAISGEVAVIAKDFIKIKNTGDSFDRTIVEINTEIKALREGLKTNTTLTADEIDARDDYLKQVNKILKRVDDGTVFPPQALDGVEASVIKFEAEVSNQKGTLKLIDAIAMPSGTIVAGATACSEQGSGRWLPKPSDTLGTLVKISDPDVGYKGIPLLWYHPKPLAEMVGFLVPDWIADLVPGQYPRHKPDGTIDENLKTKVLNIATGNFPSVSIPMPMGHIWDSILRVLAGLFCGILLGVPLGLFMGLSRFAKGFFDPLIELYRPVPPLAWAPLILTIFGIQDDGKIFLLFMVAFAIMVISARTGATGTQLSKIHAAHSLGASKRQIIREVILPNSLPEILTGIRISIGVCWGTLVAAEMLAGTTGIGFVENVARKQSDYEIIWVTILLLGLLGLLFDLIMRWVIRRTIPWRGKG